MAILIALALAIWSGLQVTCEYTCDPLYWLAVRCLLPSSIHHYLHTRPSICPLPISRINLVNQWPNLVPKTHSRPLFAYEMSSSTDQRNQIDSSTVTLNLYYVSNPFQSKETMVIVTSSRKESLHKFTKWLKPLKDRVTPSLKWLF